MSEIRFVGESVKGLCGQLHMNQSQFAQYVGTSPQNVNNWVNERSGPSAVMVDKMHHICHQQGFEPPKFFEIDAAAHPIEPFKY